MDAELEVGNDELIVREQCSPANTLTIDTCPVGAAEVAQQEQSVRLDDHTVHFRDALVIQADVALFFPADDSEILDDLDRRAAVKRQQLGAHEHSIPGASVRR